MRKIDEKGLSLCRFQAELFESSLKYEISSPVFIREFMNSDYAKRMDADLFCFENFPFEKYGETKQAVRKFVPEAMYWMGFLYRYWSYTYEVTSRYVFSIIPGVELCRLFEPYHTMDCSKAIERIYEAKGPFDVLSDVDLAKKYYFPDLS